MSHIGKIFIASSLLCFHRTHKKIAKNLTGPNLNPPSPLPFFLRLIDNCYNYKIDFRVFVTHSHSHTHPGDHHLIVCEFVFLFFSFFILLILPALTKTARNNVNKNNLEDAQKCAPAAAMRGEILLIWARKGTKKANLRVFFWFKVRRKIVCC